MYLNINSETRTVITDAPEDTYVTRTLANAAAAIMDVEQGGARYSSMNALLELLEEYADMFGYDMTMYSGRTGNDIAEIHFDDTLEPPTPCTRCGNSNMSDCLHM